jgi:hypothetical protein
VNIGGCDSCQLRLLSQKQLSTFIFFEGAAIAALEG